MLSQIRRNAKRVVVPVIGAGIMALAITGGAAASKSHRVATEAPEHAKIVAKGHKESTLRFPKVLTVAKGGTLSIRNHTPAPHSVTLVQQHLVPKSKQEIKDCFHPGHICRKAAKWHKFDGQAIHRNPVPAGHSGWSTEGSLHHRGDSVLFGAPFGPDKPKTRQVHAPHGTVLHYICIIHPWMHGRVIVE